RAVPGGTELVHGHDPGMGQLRGRARLPEEALHDLWVRDMVRAQKLQRDVAIESGIARDEHAAECTFTEFLPESVLAEGTAGVRYRRSMPAVARCVLEVQRRVCKLG